MTSIRQTGVRLALALAALLALTIGAAGAAAAATPGTLRALDLTSPSLGGLVTVSHAGGGTFRAEPGRALLRITPTGEAAAQALAWCVDPDAVIAEDVDYPVEIQSPADTPALAGPGFPQAGWLIASSSQLIADAPDPGLEAAAIQVTVWQLTGSVADIPAVTSSAAINARVAQLRALSAGKALVSAISLTAPAAPVTVGTPVTVTVAGTPGAVVDLVVSSGAGTLSAAQVVVPASGSTAVTLTPTAPGPVAVGASAQGGALHRAAHLAGRTRPQDMAYVTPLTLSASATVTATAAPLAPLVTPPAVVPVTRAPSATLGITKTAPAKVTRGRTIAYRLVVTNTSAVTARAVVLRDPVPVGTFVTRLPDRARLRSGSVVWNLGTLAPGARVVVHLRLRTSPTAQGDVLNVAAASASNAATVRARATTGVLLPGAVKPARVQPSVTG